MRNWQVWVQSREFSGALSYIYPFRVLNQETAEDAIDHVLTTYCATRDGRRFLSDPLTQLSSAWAAPVDEVTEVQLRAIDQPQYERISEPVRYERAEPFLFSESRSEGEA